MNELHPVQRQIIELLEKLGTAKFNSIKPEQIDPHLFVYHLEKLQAEGIIEKTEDGLYQFTEDGRHALSSFHQGVGLYDANVNSYVVIALRWQQKFLTVQRTRVPFLGYQGFLSMHIDKQANILAGTQAFLTESVITTGQLRMSLLLDIVYRSRSSNAAVQHSLIFVVAGELSSNSLPSEIEEGSLSLLTKAELLGVDKGYSNTKDILDCYDAGSVTYLEREYFDEL